MSDSREKGKVKIYKQFGPVMAGQCVPLPFLDNQASLLLSLHFLRPPTLPSRVDVVTWKSTFWSRYCPDTLTHFCLLYPTWTLGHYFEMSNYRWLRMSTRAAVTPLLPLASSTCRRHDMEKHSSVCVGYILRDDSMRAPKAARPDCFQGERGTKADA